MRTRNAQTARRYENAAIKRDRERRCKDNILKGLRFVAFAAQYCGGCPRQIYIQIYELADKLEQDWNEWI